MRPPIIITFLAGISFATLLFSCRKDPAVNGGPIVPITARIATVKEVDHHDTSFYNLFYNPDGTMDSMIRTGPIGYKRTYKVVYHSGYALFRQDEYTVGELQPTRYLDSIRLTAKGLPDTIFAFVGGASAGSEVFQYNAAGEIQQITYYRANGQQRGQTRFFWKDGNLVQGQEAGLVINYHYDKSKPSQPGEPFLWYTRKQQGIPYFQNKNLATGFDIFGAPTPYQYTWDNNLLHTASYTESGDTSFLEYTYY